MWAEALTVADKAAVPEPVAVAEAEALQYSVVLLDNPVASVELLRPVVLELTVGRPVVPYRHSVLSALN